MPTTTLSKFMVAKGRGDGRGGYRDNSQQFATDLYEWDTAADGKDFCAVPAPNGKHKKANVRCCSREFYGGCESRDIIPRTKDVHPSKRGTTRHHAEGCLRDVTLQD